MKSQIAKSFTVALAIAAALAVPTAVKAQADIEPDATNQGTEEISTEANICFIVPGYGLICW